VDLRQKRGELSDLALAETQAKLLELTEGQQMAGQPQNANGTRLSPLSLTLLMILVFGSFFFLPRISGNPRLAAAIGATTGFLLVFFFVLRHRVVQTGRILTYDFKFAKVHYVQALMQSCVYFYWGRYWPEVYSHVPLIAAQIILVYALDMMVCWWRRDNWVFGVGPFPIILSTNLFMWFKDDWFFLQFLMVAAGVLGKEFIRWKREGRLTHIFNPSAFGLFLFSVALLVTKNTPLTWGEEIATTLGRPPNIYLEIFLVGLVVQALFSVTLVTLSAAASLCLLNLAYTQLTGVYHFVDSNIPIAVFLGLHLLVTDPATSPRTTWGKIMFGGLYGAGVFALYGTLAWLGAPRFYDKLLCVPVLNLMVRALDRAGAALPRWFGRLAAAWKFNPRQANLAFMGIWVVLFVTMSWTHFVGAGHPGSNLYFWQQACDSGKWKSCQTWVRTLNLTCASDSAPACLKLGQVLNEGRVVARDALEAGRSFGRACDLGLPMACWNLAQFTSSGGADVFQKACDKGDGGSCFILGSLVSKGMGIPQDASRSVKLFGQSCADGWPRGCGRLGESYLWGEGTAADAAKAMENFEKACQGRSAPACYNAALMYRRGIGQMKDETLAHQRFQLACDYGLLAACDQVATKPVSSPVVSRPGASLPIVKP